MQVVYIQSSKLQSLVTSSLDIHAAWLVRTTKTNVTIKEKVLRQERAMHVAYLQSSKLESKLSNFFTRY